MKFSFDHFRQETPVEKFDVRWAEAYAQIPLLEVVDRLAGDKTYLAEEKRKFESGEIENPTLTYPYMSAAELEDTERRLLHLKDDVAHDMTRVTDEPTKAIAQAYRWRTNERIAEVRMLKASAAGDMRRFDRYTRFVHGAPSPELFNYTLEEIRGTFSPYLADEREEVRAATAHFLDTLPKTTEPSTISLPPAELVATVHASTKEHLGHLIDPSLQEGVQHDATAIARAFTYALAHGGLDGWTVVITPTVTAINTNQEKHLVEGPAKRRPVSTQKLRELIVHEIGTHVARREAGEHTGMHLLATGLDRYIVGEEGVATFHEQGIRGSLKEYAGQERYLGIGLALGLDGTPRTFREVYEILKLYNLAKELRDKEASLEGATKKALSKAWLSTLRTFRGTDGKTPGVAFTKDIAYRDGNIRLWQRIMEHPEEIKRLSSGKYDPSQERHRWILDNLHILEDEFEKLSSGE